MTRSAWRDIWKQARQHYGDLSRRREFATTILFLKRHPDYDYEKNHELLMNLMIGRTWTLRNLERLYFYLRDETNVLL